MKFNITCLNFYFLTYFHFRLDLFVILYSINIIENKEADMLAKIGITFPILEPELVKTFFAFLRFQINKVKKLEYRLLLESYTKPKT